MNRKQSHETSSHGYGQGTYKISYQVNSPYVELLESKKKVYGHRYDHKANRSFTHTAPTHIAPNNTGPNNTKPSPASISSMFAPGTRSFKSASTEKVKYARGSTNEKKKRNKTETADDKMHESLCVYPSAADKQHQQMVSKSLHYGEGKLHNIQFQPNSYFQELSAKKNRRKRHLSENKYSNNQGEEKNNQSIGMGALQNLHIQDIEGLISLIDNCVQEANDYIAYLSQNLESMKEQLMEAKAAISQKEQQIYVLVAQHQKKDSLLLQKDHYILELEKQLAHYQTNATVTSSPESGFEVKNLLQVMEKMNEENEKLRQELAKTRMERSAIMAKQQERSDSRGKDFYSSKIDILNISIDSNSPHGSKDRRGDPNKKYKFIKPKGGR